MYFSVPYFISFWLGPSGAGFFCSWWVLSLFSDDSGRVFTRGWWFKVHGAGFYGWVRYSLNL